jgi:hypothetical protein
MIWAVVIDVVLRELLAATLAAGATVKLLQPDPTWTSLQRLGVPTGWIQAATRALIVVEWGCVGLLVLAPGAVVGGSTASLFAVFALVTWRLGRGSSSPSACGCLPQLRRSAPSLPLPWRVAGRCLGVAAALVLATDPSHTWVFEPGRMAVVVAAALGAMLAIFGQNRLRRRPAYAPVGWPTAPASPDGLVGPDPAGDDREVSRRGPVVHHATPAAVGGFRHHHESWQLFRRDVLTVGADLAREVAKVTPALHGFSSTVRCDDPRGAAFCDRLISMGAFGPAGSQPAVLAQHLEQISRSLDSTAALVDVVQAAMRAADQP